MTHIIKQLSVLGMATPLFLLVWRNSQKEFDDIFTETTTIALSGMVEPKAEAVSGMAEPKACGLSVMFGSYEKTAKEPKPGLNPAAPLFLFTDRNDLLNNSPSSSWTPVAVNPELWEEDCARFKGERNNPCNNTNPFNLGKFFKTQFYRLPALREAGCNVVIWFDGSIQLHNETFMTQMESRAERGQNFVTYEHDYRRKGLIKNEAAASNVPKYSSSYRFGAPQPPQPVLEQYDHYLATGFTEKWFGDGFRNEYGMYVTCMVMFDLRQPITKKFLDCWWEEIVKWTTQDQISFPYCAWKLGVIVHALPDAWAKGTSKKNVYYTKMKHGV